MLKLFKYLKPYTFSILVCTALLFLQANMDLTLPDYMSRIVNTGVQQNGIDSAVPVAIRQTEMKNLELFFGDKEKQEILDAYTLLEPGTGDAVPLELVYPALKNEALYILSEGAETDAFEIVFSRAFSAVAGITQMASGTGKSSGGPGMPDLSMIPEGSDFFSILSTMPEEQRSQILAMISSKVGQIDEIILTQGALRLVNAEYQAIGMDTGKMQSRYIINMGAMMLLFTLISILANIIAGLLASRSAAGMAQTVRSDIFNKVEHFSGEEFDKFSTASLITRTTNDVTQVQLVIFMMLRMVIYAPILGVGGVIRALGKAPSMAWIIGLAVLALLGLITIVFIIATPKFKSIQRLIDRLNLVTRENLSGLMVVRAFNRQKFEEKRFDKANKDLTGVNLYVTRVMVIMMPAMMLIMNLLSVAIIWVGAHQVAESSMQVGDMMAFLQYAMQIVMSFLMLSMIFIFLPRAAVSGTRISEVLETEPTISDPENPEDLPSKVRGRIEFKDVSFTYPGAEENALSGINFIAEPGKTTAIIGSTGSGKSTILNLIPRFYDITGGVILLDGQDIRKIRQKDLRSQIGYVPQKVTLFSGTIESNLKYADENASEETLRQSAEIAQAMEFISSKPEGLNTPIAQGGQNISGGQKQRLSIARALVKKAPVYIFDDSFSALDFKTDAALRKAMKEKTGDSTLIIVAQRVSTIMKAEQIIVLDEGGIVGKGTHGELLKSCEAYSEIAYSQLSMEELS
ncbi:MAG: ABC transporter ATP-binding protein [Spirochaetales bacterium]|nr:ABC transporter ATP-binding protein [Spirochaetales bacterium]